MLHVNMTPDTQWYNLTCVCVFMRPIDDYRSTRPSIPEDRHTRMYSILNVTAVAVFGIFSAWRFNHDVSLILERNRLNVSGSSCGHCEQKRGWPGNQSTVFSALGRSEDDCFSGWRWSSRSVKLTAIEWLSLQWTFLTFRGPCIVIYSYNKRCTISQIYFGKELYMFRTDLLSFIRNPNTVFTATGICHTSDAVC